jgi:subtilisin family serine protease
VRSAGAPQGEGQYVVKTTETSRGEVRAQLEQMVGRLRVRYLPFDAFVVTMTNEQSLTVSELPGCLGVYHLPWVRALSLLVVAVCVLDSNTTAGNAATSGVDTLRAQELKVHPALLDARDSMAVERDTLLSKMAKHARNAARRSRAEKRGSGAKAHKALDRLLRRIEGLAIKERDHGPGHLRRTGAEQKKESASASSALNKVTRAAGRATMKLEVLLGHGAQVDLAHWEESIGAALSEDAKGKSHIVQRSSVKRASPRKVVVELSGTLREAPSGGQTASAARAAAQWLARQRQVLWVDIAPMKTVRTRKPKSDKDQERLRNANAIAVAQGGLISPSARLHQAGFFGKGQIVGTADTGVDHDGCFFHDADATSSMQLCDFGSEEMCSTSVGTVMPRKVIAYRLFSGSVEGDSFGGHGTHVAGSIAGNDVSTESANENNGAAPHAKLIVEDASADSPDDPYLYFPDSFGEDLFGFSYAKGARIHSNSWGDSRTYYTNDAAEMDEFIALNDDMLVLIAAGNDGPSWQTVGSPGTAKNVLTVGASENDVYAYPEGSWNWTGHEPSPDNLAWWSSKGPTADGRFKPDVVAVGEINSAHSSGVLGDGPDNCETTFMSGTSMATPITAGTAALLRQYISEGNLIEGIMVDSVMVDISDGSGSGSDGGGTGRRLLASGQRRLSAAEKALNAFEPSAALIKAMLMHGAKPLSFQVSGGDSDAQTRLPNFAVGYGSVDLSYLPLESDLLAEEACEGKDYDRYQCLSVGCCAWSSADGESHCMAAAPGALCYPPDPAALGGASHTLKVSQHSTLGTGDVEDHCISVTGVGDYQLWVTLVWTDAPGSPMADAPLVNDLDLEVIGPNGAIYYGNNLTSTDEQYTRAYRDAYNNAEQVRVRHTCEGCSNATFLVRVKGRDVPDGWHDGRQKFALVVRYRRNDVCVRVCARVCVHTHSHACRQAGLRTY